MKKFMISVSALALSGSMAFAMEEDAMDEEMMMEAPAPSVTLTGEAKMGIKNVSSSPSLSTDGLALIEDFQVKFSASGTTDGGLMFGASLAIEQDGRDAGKVKGSTIYVGGAGGAWKLAFGDPDPGAWSSGGIGITEEDNILRATGQKIELSGKFEGASYVVTSSAPTDEGVSNQWSAGVKYDAGAVKVGVGMDSEKGLALGVGTDLSGVGTSVFYAQSEHTIPYRDAEDEVAATAGNVGRAAITERTAYLEKASGVGIAVSVPTGDSATFSAAYSTRKEERTAVVTDGEDTAGAGLPGNETIKKIQLDFDYVLGGGATFNAGVDQEDSDVASTGKKTTIEASIKMEF